MSGFLWYLLGLLTLPGLWLLGWLVLSLWWGLLGLLKTRWGVTMEWKRERAPEDIPNWRFKRDIWFEKKWRRPASLAFSGHWCRDERGRSWATRWVGFGHPDGPALIIYRKREL